MVHIKKKKIFKKEKKKTLGKDVQHEQGGYTKFHNWKPYMAHISLVAAGIFYLMVMWTLCGWRT